MIVGYDRVHILFLRLNFIVFTPAGMASFVSIITLLALLLIGTSLVLVLVLHAIKPEISPRVRMLSELEIGRHGWLMRQTFALFAVGVALVGYQAAALGALIGGSGMVVAAIGPIGAAIFITEPIDVPTERRGREDRIHAAFGALFLLLFPVAASLVTGAGLAALQPLGLWLWALVSLIWLSLVALFAVTGTGPGRGQKLGVDLPLGVPNRINMLSISVWLIAVSIALRSA